MTQKYYNFIIHIISKLFAMKGIIRFVTNEMQIIRDFYYSVEALNIDMFWSMPSTKCKFCTTFGSTLRSSQKTLRQPRI